MFCILIYSPVLCCTKNICRDVSGYPRHRYHHTIPPSPHPVIPAADLPAQPHAQPSTAYPLPSESSIILVKCLFRGVREKKTRGKTVVMRGQVREYAASWGYVMVGLGSFGSERESGGGVGQGTM